jgi:HlyD family secretion protein
VNNVTTYATMINVPNKDYRLKPGMTANLKVQVARESGVLRVPNTALRFRPSLDTFAALHEPVPPEALSGGRGRGGRNANAQTSQNQLDRPAGSPRQSNAQGQPGSQGQGPTQAGGADADRQTRMIDRFKAMSPDEQRQFIAHMVDRGQDTSTFERLMDGKAAKLKKPAAARSAPAFVFKPRYGSAESSQTIDSLFPAMPRVEGPGRVWIFADHQLKPVNIRVGITDGTFTELKSTELQEGMEVVTNVTGVGTRTAAQTGGGNPLMPPQRGGPGGFAGGPGRGR